MQGSPSFPIQMPTLRGIASAGARLIPYWRLPPIFPSGPKMSRFTILLSPRPESVRGNWRVRPFAMTEKAGRGYLCLPRLDQCWSLSTWFSNSVLGHLAVKPQLSLSILCPFHFHSARLLASFYMHRAAISEEDFQSRLPAEDCSNLSIYKGPESGLVAVCRDDHDSTIVRMGGSWMSVIGGENAEDFCGWDHAIGWCATVDMAS